MNSAGLECQWYRGSLSCDRVARQWCPIRIIYSSYSY